MRAGTTRLPWKHLSARVMRLGTSKTCTVENNARAAFGREVLAAGQALWGHRCVIRTRSKGSTWHYRIRLFAPMLLLAAAWHLLASTTRIRTKEKFSNRQWTHDRRRAHPKTGGLFLLAQLGASRIISRLRCCQLFMPCKIIVEKEKGLRISWRVTPNLPNLCAINFEWRNLKKLHKIFWTRFYYLFIKMKCTFGHWDSLFC